MLNSGIAAVRFYIAILSLGYDMTEVAPFAMETFATFSSALRSRLGPTPKQYNATKTSDAHSNLQIARVKKQEGELYDSKQKPASILRRVFGAAKYTRSICSICGTQVSVAGTDAVTYEKAWFHRGCVWPRLVRGL